MIPVRLTLNGFLSYRGEVELDFSEVDLACVIGQNGAGKSSLLDAITWALFGKARSSDDDLVNLNEEQAQVWFEFLYEDQRYRIERVKKRGSTKQVLFNVWSPEDGMWSDFSGGTSTATQEKIERILRMDYDTFINASFFLQGKADQFAQQRPGERKRTLAKILELDVWEQYRLLTSEKRRQLERDLDLQNARLHEIEDALRREPELLEELDTLKKQLSQTEALVETQEKLVNGLRKAQQQISSQKEQVAILADALQRAKTRQSNAESALAETREKQQRYQELLSAESEVKNHYDAWVSQQTQLDAMDAVALSFNEISKKREVPMQRLIAEESRLTSERKHLSELAGEVSKKESELVDLQAKLAEAIKEQTQIRDEISQYISLEEKHDEFGDQRRELEPDVIALRKELLRLKERKLKLESLDAVECPTCGQPLTELHRNEILDELKETHSALRDEYERKNQQLETIQHEMAALDQIIRSLKEREERELVKRVNVMISSYEAKIQTWIADIESWREQGFTRLTEVDAILDQKAFCNEERELLRQTDEQLVKMGYNPELHERLRRSVQDGRHYQQDFQALNEARSVLSELSQVQVAQELTLKDSLEEVQNTQISLSQAENVLEGLVADGGDYTAETRKLMQVRDEYNLMRQSVGGAEQRLNALKEKRSIKQTILQEREGLIDAIGQHKILEEAFGKNGVPAMLIEQALPEIEEQANLILDRLSTTGMMVQLMTQGDYKDIKRVDKKETLDIIISDEVGVRPYEMYSGGEAFRVNFAIRLALSRMLAARTGARLQTLVIDEGFGSQDADGVQRLVSTINAIKHDFAKIIVITHLEALKGAFPTQIEITKTAIGSQLQIVQE